MFTSIEWKKNFVRFLDQTALPLKELYNETSDINVLADAIRTLKLRGAPLIGISAAYGVLLGVQPYKNNSPQIFMKQLELSISLLAATRPTAKNLFWALERMRNSLRLTEKAESNTFFEILENEALAIHNEDRQMCEAMGKFGASLIPQKATILTHCNTGALATGGIGTALGVIATAFHSGKNIFVYADETRPLLQGARLTMWELQQLGISAKLITDNTAAWTMKQKHVDLVIVGADRITANGDTANKIGTYNVAILAKEHSIPFYVAAPSSTIDFSLHSGDEIPIEERGTEEIVHGFGNRTAPEGTEVFAPAFDVTPNKYITAIITERGIHTPPFTHSLHESRPL